MSVWNDEHPKPPGGEEHERALLKWITEDSQQQIDALMPHDEKSLTKYREVVGGAVDVMIGRGVPQPEAPHWEFSSNKSVKRGKYRMYSCLLRYSVLGERVPTVAIELEDLDKDDWVRNPRIVIWIDKSGKKSLFDTRGDPRPPIAKLLDAGFGVVGIDLFGQGEFTTDGRPLAKTRLIKEDYAGYTFGYNHPVVSQRVHDVLAWLSLTRMREGDGVKVYVVGLGDSGHWAAAACARAGDAVEAAVIDTAGFRFGDVTAIDDPDFLPGGAKYGDLPGMIALAAPKKLWLAGEGNEVPPVVAAAYKAAGKPENVTLFSGKQEDKEAAAVEWLLRQRSGGK